LLFGFQARFAAFGLGIFSILTAFLFHQGGADAAAQYNNGIHFMKNLAMAGGLFFLMLHGAGRISLDHAIEK
ncbi:DoxX family protein, partial [Acinetobacter baumannii]|nr:DoxX family protein [Acinetobacter baumannii]